MRRRHLLATLLACPPAQAQSPFPSPTLRYIVPVAAGGGSDLVGRTVTERWAKALGQGIVVDHLGGGGGPSPARPRPRPRPTATPCCKAMWPPTALARSLAASCPTTRSRTTPRSA